MTRLYDNGITYWLSRDFKDIFEFMPIAEINALSLKENSAEKILRGYRANDVFELIIRNCPYKLNPPRYNCHIFCEKIYEIVLHKINNEIFTPEASSQKPKPELLVLPVLFELHNTVILTNKTPDETLKILQAHLQSFSPSVDKFCLKYEIVVE